MYFRVICSLQTGQSINYHIALKAMFYLLNIEKFKPMRYKGILYI